MRSFWYITLCLLLLSCRKENALDCFKSNGQDQTEIRHKGSFDMIKVYDKIDLVVKQGSDYAIEVRAGKNILSNISTENLGGVLVIKNKNKCNFVRGYKKTISVTVTVPTINQVNNEGVGTLRIDESFQQDTLIVRAENSGDIHVNGKYKQVRTSSHGNGDVYLKGECNSLRIFSFGTNYTFGRDLKVNEQIFIETLSIGHCYITAPANGKLEYNLWRSGNIYYTGTPAEIVNYSNGTGTGKLIKE